MYMQDNYMYAEAGADNFRGYLTKTFLIMGLGLVVTAIVGFFGFLSIFTGGIMYSVAASPFGMMICTIAQFGVCIALSAGLMKFNRGTCFGLFMAYSVLTGITFSILPLYAGVSTVFTAFAFAAVLFFSCAVIGATTKVDLSKFAGLMMAGLITILITGIIGMFINLSFMELGLSWLGVFIFLGLTAWDTQKIKSIYYGCYDVEMRDKMAIYAAFGLYLDFINIFLRILSILGSSKGNRK